MKLNPIYQKELKLRTRKKHMILVTLGYNLLLAFFGLFAFYITFTFGESSMGSGQYGSILNVYAVIVAIQFGFLLFIIPAVTATAVAEEREKQTLEILLITKIESLKVITGKLASSISFLVFLGISSLPILSLVFSIGGIRFWDLLEVIVLILVTAIYIGSIGLFFSTLYKRSSVATICSYMVMIALVAGTIGAVWGAFKIQEIMAQQLYTIGDIYPGKPDVGNWLLLLLVNPAVTCISMIERHTGTGIGLQGMFSRFGILDGWIMEYWFLISILIQLGIGTLCLIGAGKLLNPLKKKGAKARNRRVI